MATTVKNTGKRRLRTAAPLPVSPQQRLRVWTRRLTIANSLMALGLLLLPVPGARGQGRIDVNTASSGELQTLDGVGPRVAMKFIAEREANGPYRSLGDLQRRVLGVDDRMLESLRRQGLFAGRTGGGR